MKEMLNKLSCEMLDTMLQRKDKFSEVYKIGQLIGAGTYGEVRVCQIISSGQYEPRAVRVLEKSKMDDSDINKFMTEMLILINTDHPSIMKVQELFQDQHFFYIVCDLCKGGDLFQYIEMLNQNGGEMSEKDAAKIIFELLSALAYLHKNHIICMDLKPENILF